MIFTAERAADDRASESRQLSKFVGTVWLCFAACCVNYSRIVPLFDRKVVKINENLFVQLRFFTIVIAYHAKIRIIQFLSEKNLILNPREPTQRS